MIFDRRRKVVVATIMPAALAEMTDFGPHRASRRSRCPAPPWDFHPSILRAWRTSIRQRGMPLLRCVLIGIQVRVLPNYRHENVGVAIHCLGQVSPQCPAFLVVADLLRQVAQRTELPFRRQNTVHNLRSQCLVQLLMPLGLVAAATWRDAIPYASTQHQGCVRTASASKCARDISIGTLPPATLNYLRTVIRRSYVRERG